MSYFCQLGYGQIYPTLGILEKEALVTMEVEGKAEGPTRKVYTITDSGKIELRKWLEKPVAKEIIRYEILLKVFFGARGDKKNLVEHIKKFRERNANKLRVMKEYEGGPSVLSVDGTYGKEGLPESPRMVGRGAKTTRGGRRTERSVDPMKRQRVRKFIIFIAAALFPIIYYFLSPYLIIMGASEGVVSGSFVVFGLTFISALVFGRGFCGWVCPAGGLQEACFKLRDKKHNGTWRNYLKYVIWVPWIAIIIVMFSTSGGIKTFDPLYQTYYGISITNIPSLILFIIIALIVAGTALISGKRGFCHSFCWMAPFMIIGRWIGNKINISALRLKSDGSGCIRCKRCDRTCPMSLEVEKMVSEGNMNDAECIMCGSCADGCPKGVISLSFGKTLSRK